MNILCLSIFFLIGVYKPRVRCYETSELCMKFERCLDSESEYSTIYGSMSAISVNFGRGLYRGILVMREYV